jgi:hypothetical protein
VVAEVEFEFMQQMFRQIGTDGWIGEQRVLREESRVVKPRREFAAERALAGAARLRPDSHPGNCLEHRRELLRRRLDRRSKKATRKRSPQKSITVVFVPPASSGKLRQRLGVGSIL